MVQFIFGRDFVSENAAQMSVKCGGIGLRGKYYLCAHRKCKHSISYAIRQKQCLYDQTLKSQYLVS